MAHIVIFHIGVTPNYEGGDDLVYTGHARCSGMAPETPDLGWNIAVDPGALATTINTAIKDAAIAVALSDNDITVGALDKKTIIGGAIGL